MTTYNFTMRYNFTKNALMTALEPYQKQGYMTRAEAGRKLGCADNLVKSRIGECLKVVSVGTKKAFLYHESQIEAYLNKSQCANCVE